MVRNQLVIQSRELPHQHAHVERVEYKVTACVDKSPDMQISRRIKARLIGENISIFANGKHGEYGEGDIDDCHDGRLCVLSVLSLLHFVKLLVALVP